MKPGAEVRLNDIDSAFKDRHESHKDAAEGIEHYERRLRALQDQLYAGRRPSVRVRFHRKVLSHCSAEHTPWLMIPADHKWFRNLLVARINAEHR